MNPLKRSFIIAFSVHSLAVGHDSWFGADKIKHFFLGSFVQSLGFAGLQSVGVSRSASLAGASALTFSVVIGKELRDRNGRGDPSVKDAAWGLAGAAAISPVLWHTK